ncbi:hypothetical protein DEO72_LG7g2548 [Vigna unguiculata]|uniref:C2H2-type domain-containing protein n=2 Tax=Vigna unguiculata TaxID=3917 RepID=A0A4D6MIN2_VIGUN|nr:hypothetical protein DEO72_LG7g2548 [Vigna unguiculata]
MKSQSEVDNAVIIGDDRKNNWEERGFAEDAAASMWPPRPYSCTFCKREFRSAQALGGHMNIHRRDKARLKQNPNPHHHNYQPFYHHTIKPLLGNHNHHRFSAPLFSTQINCGITHSHSYSSQATTISTTRSISQENKFSHTSSSSFIFRQMGSPNSEQEKEYSFGGLECGNFVETSLSQNSSPCWDRPNMSCKRLKNSICSLPLFLRPCSKDKGLALQPVEIPLGLHHRIEDLDLELRLGKQQKVE